MPNNMGSSYQGAGAPQVVSSKPQPTTRTKVKVKVRSGKPGSGKPGGNKNNGGGNKPPADPLNPLVRAAMKLQYGPAIAAAQRQQAQIPGYFDTYRSTLQGIQGGVANQYGQGLAQLGQLANGLNQGTANVLAAARGQLPVPGGQANQGVLDDAAKAAAVRSQMLGGFGGLIASQGLTEGNYLANRAANSGPLQITAQQQAGQRVTDLLGQRGASAVDYRGKLEAAAAQNELDRQKIASALRIAGIQSATTIATNTQDNQASQANNRRTTATSRANNQRTTATSRANNITTNANRNNGLTPAQRAKQRQDARKAITRIHDLNSRFQDYKTRLIQPLGPDGKPSGPKRPPTRPEIRQKLRDDGFTGPEIYLAFKFRSGTRFSRHDMEIARELGIVVPKRLYPSDKFGGKKKQKIKGGSVNAGVGSSVLGNVK